MREPLAVQAPDPLGGQQVSVYDLIVGDVVELGTGDEVRATCHIES